MKIQLVAKTNKAKNRLREAGTKCWTILETVNEVSFSDRKGPWHYVRPDSNEDKRDHCRWVSATDDPDFNIVFNKE